MTWYHHIDSNQTFYKCQRTLSLWSYLCSKSWSDCDWRATSANVCSWLSLWTTCMYDENKSKLQRAGRVDMHCLCVWTCELYDMMHRCRPAAGNYLGFRVSCIFFVTFVTRTCDIFNNFITSVCFEFINGIRSNSCVCTLDCCTFGTAAACLVAWRCAHEDDHGERWNQEEYEIDLNHKYKRYYAQWICLL